MSIFILLYLLIFVYSRFKPFSNRWLFKTDISTIGDSIHMRSPLNNAESDTLLGRVQQILKVRLYEGFNGRSMFLDHRWLKSATDETNAIAICADDFICRSMEVPRLLR